MSVKQSLPAKTFGRIAQEIDHRIGWDRLPKWLGLAVLAAIRDTLRAHNLFDTNVIPHKDQPVVAPFEPEFLVQRSADGTYNDLSDPRMGMAGARFGRNVPLSDARPETGSRLLTPDPRMISRRLLTRGDFQPATTLNLLAATWIQFMVKDWFSHGEGDPSKPYRLTPAPDDKWPEADVFIPSVIADPTWNGQPGDLPTFINHNSPWWDGSSIYGDSIEQQKLIRTGVGGKLKVSDDGLIILPDDPSLDPALVPGFWVGLAMMGSLFCLEHNSVCDAIAAENPTWDDEELFQRARLTVAALIAKIHTVQWTPAIISHPTTVAALRANWYGLAGQKIKDAFGRISSNELVSGIVGGEFDHFGTPYSLTEEFGIVYRMHPLIPDDYEVRDWQTDAVEAEYTMRELSGPSGKKILVSADMTKLLYSFGTSHPGAIQLHNFPKFLQEFLRPDGEHYTDLAATDIIRTRELGVPRYNEFRRLLHLTPAKTFADFSDDVAVQRELADIYGDVESVDTIIGMFAEKKPEGFGFSDTAFRIFILMASRRLNSDRFFTNDFSPEVYSPAGFRWVTDNDMTSVLLRHYPQLRAALHSVKNPFAPWQRSTPETPQPQ